MSPNHPQKYPNILQKTERIEVETGKVLRLEFTFFELQWDALCAKDYVKIKDGDGTTLMENSWFHRCGGRPEGGPWVEGRGGHWRMQPGWLLEAIRQAPSGSKHLEGSSPCYCSFLVGCRAVCAELQAPSRLRWCQPGVNFLVLGTKYRYQNK